METVSDFIYWGSKITEDGNCSHEIKRRLLLESKVMTHLETIALISHASKVMLKILQATLQKYVNCELGEP